MSFSSFIDIKKINHEDPKKRRKLKLNIAGEMNFSVLIGSSWFIFFS